MNSRVKVAKDVNSTRSVWWYKLHKMDGQDDIPAYFIKDFLHSWSESIYTTWTTRRW
jgi:hypothetical protein